MRVRVWNGLKLYYNIYPPSKNGNHKQGKTKRYNILITMRSPVQMSWEKTSTSMMPSTSREAFPCPALP